MSIRAKRDVSCFHHLSHKQVFGAHCIIMYDLGKKYNVGTLDIRDHYCVSIPVGSTTRCLLIVT